MPHTTFGKILQTLQDYTLCKKSSTEGSGPSGVAVVESDPAGVVVHDLWTTECGNCDARRCPAHNVRTTRGKHRRVAGPAIWTMCLKRQAHVAVARLALANRWSSGLMDRPSVNGHTRETAAR